MASVDYLPSRTVNALSVVVSRMKHMAQYSMEIPNVQTSSSTNTSCYGGWATNELAG